MAAPNFLAEIQLSYNQFTRTERKIADYVIKNTDKVLFMSLSDLSTACKVADASVHRFCRRVGVKGYQEFKMKLSLSMTPDEGADKTENAENIKSGSLDQMMDSILENHINALKETRRLVNGDEVSKIVWMMEKAKRIYFFGIGDSLLTAQSARNKFLRITNKVTCISDPHMQAMAASMATEEDLIIFISYSGSTKDNVYVAQIAQESGAKIVAITRFLKSPLTEYADELLVCGSNEGPLEGGSMGAKLSQLFIVDILFNEYYRRNKGLSKENNKKTSKAVVEKLF